ncbi:signal recognition particle-docking protein FtsY [Hippea maritima]|uniref:Signal recognition particle receptor FtsY n=1 Tax=Hippea maritima (strain ATCC 700847 / DSM 10411 / MH2) TaxID=760142 RepID=F2LVJ3_HIPMA|nr:signal recognition particle-docking protein FtsY [Hippea maritima]AEA33777.1 signal recognition particle-docking protein FtsY [Hippea maritima DSM 10411]
MGFLKGIADKLFKTKQGFTEKIHEESKKDEPITDEYLDFIEELLIESDFGVKTTMKIMDAINEGIDSGSIRTRQDVEIKIREVILSILKQVEKPLEIKHKKFVILVVGINGSGKTTTIGKLASLNTDKGKKVMLVAADTFRAAAIEQLEEWAKRASASIVKQNEGADPAAVAFDGVSSGIARNYDVIFVDTAGRLHTQKNLMNEVIKIKKAVQKAYPEAPHEVLLVLDATIGQNAINQAREFNKALAISGIVLTKMDGTAKGGIIVAISEEFKIPIRYIGIGESLDDLKAFNARDFVESVFVP